MCVGHKFGTVVAPKPRPTVQAEKEKIFNIFAWFLSQTVSWENCDSIPGKDHAGSIEAVKESSMQLSQYLFYASRTEDCVMYVLFSGQVKLAEAGALTGQIRANIKKHVGRLW